jgi:cellulose synthase/poly-beta-1,6-N-acetylglucosamine synthase-like glycosyltransferase
MLIFLAGFLLIFYFFILIHLFRQKNYTAAALKNHEVKFSIIIAAKNEEKNLPFLFDSLKKLNYPADLFEIIIVDDSSYDNTPVLLKDFVESFDNIKSLKAVNKKFPGKKGALEIGIVNAVYPFIIITDADCRPQKNWLKSFEKNFLSGNEIVLGAAPLNYNGKIVSKISAFENLKNSILSFAAADAGFPYTAAARSFGFTKKAYEKLNGYSNTIETLSGDDDLIIREAVKKNLKIGTITSADAFVFSDAKENLNEYLKQKSRHTKTSLYYLPKHQALLAAWHLTNLFFLISPFLIFFNFYFIFLFVIKFAGDFVYIKSLQKKFGYHFKNVEIIYLNIFYEIFLVIHFLNALFTKDKWK